MSAVCLHGFKGERAGGLIDRAGQRLMLFDVDGTRETLLQRELPDVDGEPAPRLRQEATAPGYPGRKRADQVMTRMVVQQSHTQEFLGSLPMPGNGHRGPMMQWAARQIATYARSAAMPLACCVTRSDGEHGIFTQVRPVVQEGLSFLTRCADYRFLDSATVQAALAAGTTVRMTHPDSGLVRDVFEVPSIAWPSCDDATPKVRLVVTRSTFPADKKHRVGRRIGNDVFELFVTDRPPTSLHAADVVSVYLQRGQFEASLVQEESELPTGHWASNHPEGQRLWHLLAQWVWNLRLLAFARGLDDGICKLLHRPFESDWSAMPAAGRRPLDERGDEVVHEALRDADDWHVLHGSLYTMRGCGPTTARRSPRSRPRRSPPSRSPSS